MQERRCLTDAEAVDAMRSRLQKLICTDSTYATLCVETGEISAKAAALAPGPHIKVHLYGAIALGPTGAGARSPLVFVRPNVKGDKGFDGEEYLDKARPLWTCFMLLSPLSARRMLHARSRAGRECACLDAEQTTCSHTVSPHCILPKGRRTRGYSPTWTNRCVHVQIVPMIKAFAATACPDGDAYVLQDGAPQHKATVLRPLHAVPHPAQSPDLNPIEYMWVQMADMLDGLRVDTGGSRASAEAALKAVVAAAWADVAASKVCELVHALPAAMEAVHNAPGRLHETRHPIGPARGGAPS